jgi:carbamoyl-phosphate synthase large subunit
VNDKSRLLMTFSGKKNYIYTPLAMDPEADFVIAADADPLAPIRGHAGDNFVLVPKARERERYLDALLRTCVSSRIHAVAPLNSADVELLTQERTRFESGGTLVLGAEAALTSTLCDKQRASTWLRSAGFETPETWSIDFALANRDRLPFPLVAKERFGQGSQGFRVVNAPAELDHASPTSVVQPFLPGRHYDLDILAAGGHVLCVVPKLKLASTEGTASLTRSVADPKLLSLGVAVGEAVGHTGLIDVDVIDVDGTMFVLEINPRIGGCFPFACLACPQLPGALLRVARGEPPMPFVGVFETGVVGAREWSIVRLPNKSAE